MFIEPRFRPGNFELRSAGDIGVRHPFGHALLNPADPASKVFGDAVLIAPTIWVRRSARDSGRRSGRGHASPQREPTSTRDTRLRVRAAAMATASGPYRRVAGERIAALRVGAGHGSAYLLCLRRPVALERGGFAALGPRSVPLCGAYFSGPGRPFMAILQAN